MQLPDVQFKVRTAHELAHNAIIHRTGQKASESGSLTLIANTPIRSRNIWAC